MIPVYVFEKGVKLPSEGTFYVVAKNGLFLHKDTGTIKATVKVEGVSFLEEMKQGARLRLPKISQELIVRTLLFFRAVYREHKSEAEVQIHYNSDSGEYKIHCPIQEVSGGGVDYDSSDRFDGFQLVGTIHSHCNFGAFHSGIDDGDEKHFDGLHITIGHLDQPYFTISCSMTVNGQRFNFKPEDVIIGIEEVDWKPKSTVSYRRQSVPHFKQPPARRKGVVDSLFDIAFGDWGPFEPEDPGVRYEHDFSQYSYIRKPASKKQFWNIAMPEGQDYRHVGFPRNWLKRVRKPVYTPIIPIRAGISAIKRAVGISTVKKPVPMPSAADNPEALDNLSEALELAYPDPTGFEDPDLEETEEMRQFARASKEPEDNVLGPWEE